MTEVVGAFAGRRVGLPPIGRVERDRARKRHEQSRQHPQERRFAGTVAADDAQGLTALQLKSEALEDGSAAALGREVGHGKGKGPRRVPLCLRCS